MTWKSRIAALLLALCCLTAALTGCGKKQTDTAAPIDQPTQTQTAPEPVDDYKPTKGDKPYYVRVNLQAGTVTVYSRDESGYYSVPYKAMICSGGESTPRGHFKLTNWRQEWLGLVGDVYGHYCTQIKGNYLFHSVPYTEKYDKNSLQWEEYDRLGTVCSHGCIRLQLIDAKWIYDTCARSRRWSSATATIPVRSGRRRSRRLAATRCAAAGIRRIPTRTTSGSRTPSRARPRGPRPR